MKEKTRMGQKAADNMLEKGKCACCGKIVPLHMLDAKPARLAGRGNLFVRMLPRIRLHALNDAACNGEDFDRLECKDCYGAGWVQGVPVLIRPKTLKVGSK